MLRIYPLQGKRVINPDYYEVPYVEYRDDGSLRSKGTEDFSAERYRTTTKIYEIWTWDGEARNSGGHRLFERQTSYRIFGKPAVLRKVFLEAIKKETEKNGTAMPAEISIRKVL